jgi:hypothetical protein
MKQCADCGFYHDDSTETCWNCGGRELRILEASELPEAIARLRIVQAGLQSSRIEGKRDLRLAIACIAGGGTLLVVLLSLLLHDWSLLNRWVSGVIVTILVFLCFAVKRWLVRTAVRGSTSILSSENGKPNGPANGSQPIRYDTNGASSAGGSCHRP